MVGLDVGPRGGRGAAVELHAAVHDVLVTARHVSSKTPEMTLGPPQGADHLRTFVACVPLGLKRSSVGVGRLQRRQLWFGNVCEEALGCGRGNASASSVNGAEPGAGQRLRLFRTRRPVSDRVTEQGNPLSIARVGAFRTRPA